MYANHVWFCGYVICVHTCIFIIGLINIDWYSVYTMTPVPDYQIQRHITSCGILWHICITNIH